MTKILGAKGEQIGGTCDKCKNRGYYEVRGGKGDDKVQMFCTCDAGQALRRIGIEWRLNDLKNLAGNITPRLKIIKARIDEDKDKAKTFIDELVKEMEALEDRAKQNL